MAYVVTQACIGNKHTSCVDVCPVDAFREGPDMLVIDPEVCIECNACLTECPERAIFPQGAVPDDQQHFIALNAEKALIFPVIRESIGHGVAQSPMAAFAGRFAVVGSGPSGFYAAEEVLKQMPSARVDLFERLPTPFGLVRYGVAPDHPKIKSVSASFDRIAANGRLRFFGNVAIGRDLSRAELLAHYDGVIWATGGSRSRDLGIPGAELPNIFGSSSFVGWYNGHPDQQALAVDLSGPTAVVIGLGNVALDIARMLVLSPTQLARTDVADAALETFKGSAVQEVVLMARRGPAQAAFTPKELEQLMGLPNLDLIVDPVDLVLDAQTAAELDQPESGEIKQNLALLRDIAARPRVAGHKRIRFMFCHRPEAIEAVDGKKVLHAVRTVLSRDTSSQGVRGRITAQPSGEKIAIEAGLIVHAIGYQGDAVDDVPFDATRGVISNQAGRVATKEYAAGWIKRGASGVIGSNKHCASATVAQLLGDLENRPTTTAANSPDVAELLRLRGVEFISFADWQLLDAYEQEQGRLDGRPRRKVTDVAMMLDIIRKTRVQRQAEDEARAAQPVKTHLRSCTLCEAMCGVVIEYQGDRILSINGDPDDPHSTGHICPKGYALQDLHNDPDRLKKPLHKVDGQWREISWDAALDLAAEKLVGIQQQYGNDAVAGYWGNPSSHNFGLTVASGKFRKVLGSRNLYSASSLDQMPHQLVSYLMFGMANAFTIPDIDHTDYLLMLGANPAASNGSLMTAGDVLKRLEAIKHRGGKFVLVDPRRNETALYASEHLFIRPATDALFLVGLIQHVVHHKLYKPGRLKDLVSQWDELLALFDLFPLAEISKLCGIAEADIVRIAEEFCAAERAICYGRIGVATQVFGTLNHWLINVLNILTGNLDRRGGMMFTSPAVDIALKPGTAGSFNTYQTRVRGLPEFNREFPAVAMAEEMLTLGAGQIKGFICFAGNPVLSTPNGMKLDQALAQLDFMVSVDFYLNETSRHADLILPPTGPLEHEQFDLVFNSLAVRNVAKFSGPLFEHAEGTLGDFDIVQGLITRMAALKGIEQKGPDATTLQILDFSLRNGPYGTGFDEYRDGEVIHHDQGLSLKTLAQFPHGLDLGPLQPRLPDFLLTPDHKIQVMPEPIVQDLQRLKAYVASLKRDDSLVLIGRRDLRTNNSWMHNSQRLIKGKDRCALFVNPVDARQRGLKDRGQALIRSRVGTLQVDVKITEDVMPGVVCLPHGWGHDRDGIALRVAQGNPGVSTNDLTDERGIDALSGNAVLNGVPVQVNPL